MASREPVDILCISGHGAGDSAVDSAGRKAARAQRARLCTGVFTRSPQGTEHEVTHYHALVMVALRVCEVYGISSAELFGKARTPRFVQARYMAYFLLNTQFRMSASVIGRMLRCDHTTVLHGIAQVRSQCTPEEVAAARCPHIHSANSNRSL